MADDWFAQNAPAPDPVHGGQGSDWFAQNAPKEEGPGWLSKVGDAVANWWEQVNPVKQAEGVASAVRHPINTIEAYGAQNSKIAQEAEDAFKSGHYASGMAHAINYLLNGLPGVGGTLDKAQGQAESGNVPAALGTTAGLATNVIAGAKAPEIAGKIADVSGGALPKVGKVAAEVVGKTTGAGAKPFIQAAENPTPELIAQMRNPDEMEVLGHMKDAFQSVKDARATEYTQQLQKLSGPNQPTVDPNPIYQALDQKLKAFRVETVPSPPSQMSGQQYQAWQAKYAGKNPGDLDFSASPIGNKGQADIKEVNELVNNWSDWSPLGADALKRRIDDMYSESSQARALTTSIRNEVKNGIVSQVPDYATMTKGYSDASKFLDQLSDLSLNSKNPGTAIRKITTTLNQNNNYRQGLVDALDQFAGTDLKGEIAGLALSKLAPRGIMGPGTGAGIVYSLMTGHLAPAAAAGLALTSPRLMGELAVALGKAKPLIAAAATKTAPAAAAAIPVAQGGLATAQAGRIEPPSVPLAAENKSATGDDITAYANAKGISEDLARKEFQDSGYAVH